MSRDAPWYGRALLDLWHEKLAVLLALLALTALLALAAPTFAKKHGCNLKKEHVVLPCPARHATRRGREI